MWACPKKAISITLDNWYVDRKLCDSCGKCMNACVVQALGIFGRKMSVEEVISEVLKDLNFYKNSNGGVTVSGGEPLYQPKFTSAILRRCQDLGINTALETCGYASRNVWEGILPYTNLILYDLKCPDSKLHEKITGVSNRLIIRNLKLVAKSGVPTIIRIPIIPGINDSEKQIEAFAKIILENGLQEVELIPYHKYGVGKYKMLGREYPLENLMPPTNLNLKRIKDYFNSRGLLCRIIKT
jgi:pyruvate formate lyase activating enzyme